MRDCVTLTASRQSRFGSFLHLHESVNQSVPDSNHPHYNFVFANICALRAVQGCILHNEQTAGDSCEDGAEVEATAGEAGQSPVSDSCLELHCCFDRRLLDFESSD